jgi:hypothetical protein
VQATGKASGPLIIGCAQGLLLSRAPHLSNPFCDLKI